MGDAVNPGKRFEGKFRKSLLLLPGASCRFEDGGAVAKNRQLADFMYWDYDGNSFAFECKATKKPAFPMCDMGDGQMDGLLEWESMHESYHALVALNFYGENVARDNRCILVEARSLMRYLEYRGRKSVPADDAAEIGWECGRLAGNIWALDPWKAI